MSIRVVQLFVSGGPFMWPILALSVIGLAIIIERGTYMAGFARRNRRLTRYLANRGGQGGSGYRLLDEALPGLDPEAADQRITAVLQLEFDRAEKVFTLLGAVGSLAPLLGFMGTVSGMIAAFQSIAAADRVSVSLVAAGISQAMITTAFGLIVAVPCLFCDHLYRFLQRSEAHYLQEEVGRTLRLPGGAQ